tara:strand:- start:2774 stop:3028 length:255 start_codon:yes stop_codon:yes gene_type:complete
MTLVTRASFSGKSELQVGKANMLLKKYVWIDEAGKIAETTENKLPKGWRKGKLLGAKGHEVSDLQAKEWGLGKKAKAPAENKGK